MFSRTVPEKRNGSWRTMPRRRASDARWMLRMSCPSISTRPSGDVVEAGDERRDRALAGARRADEGDRLAGLHVQVDVAQDRDVRHVLEVDVVEHDLAPHVRELDGVLRRPRSPASCRAPRRCAGRRPSRAGAACTGARGRGSGRRSAARRARRRRRRRLPASRRARGSRRRRSRAPSRPPRAARRSA